MFIVLRFLYLQLFFCVKSVRGIESEATKNSKIEWNIPNVTNILRGPLRVGVLEEIGQGVVLTSEVFSSTLSLTIITLSNGDQSIKYSTFSSVQDLLHCQHEGCWIPLRVAEGPRSRSKSSIAAPGPGSGMKQHVSATTTPRGDASKLLSFPFSEESMSSSSSSSPKAEVWIAALDLTMETSFLQQYDDKCWTEDVIRQTTSKEFLLLLHVMDGLGLDARGSITQNNRLAVTFKIVEKHQTVDHAISKSVNPDSIVSPIVSSTSPFLPVRTKLSSSRRHLYWDEHLEMSVPLILASVRGKDVVSASSISIKLDSNSAKTNLGEDNTNTDSQAVVSTDSSEWHANLDIDSLFTSLLRMGMRRKELVVVLEQKSLESSSTASLSLIPPMMSSSPTTSRPVRLRVGVMLIPPQFNGTAEANILVKEFSSRAESTPHAPLSSRTVLPSVLMPMVWELVVVVVHLVRDEIHSPMI